MKIALFYNATRKNAEEVALASRGYLENAGVEIIDLTTSQVPTQNIADSTIDYCLIVGGDGTILRFSRCFGPVKFPILGVNLGGLGFMADVPIGDLYPCLDDLIAGFFTIEERLMLHCQAETSSPTSALNEVIFHRGANFGLVDLAVTIDGQIVNVFSGDGLIIATPNGSTAYSLSAGGPIVTPELEAIILTPICSHAMTQRPLILKPQVAIEVEVVGHNEPVDVVVDAEMKCRLTKHQGAKIERSTEPFRWINLQRRNYFSTLRSKLGWSGSLKNRA